MSELNDSPHARIAIRYGDSSFEIEGPESVVERALERYLQAIGKMFEGPSGTEAPLGLVHTAQADAGSRNDGPTDLDTWYQERLVHPEGKRGIVQDHVLLFVYYATEVRGNASASTAVIRSYFEKLQMKSPNVPVMVYNLKAKGSLSPADEYASYVLTPSGKAYIEDRFGILKRG